MASSTGGFDNTSHPLINFHEPPGSLTALRQELANHPDIVEKAILGTSFEDCLGIIALHLDIALDGMYDVEPLCSMLVEVLRKRRFFPTSPHLRHSSLVDAELIETEGLVSIEKRDRNVTTIIPEDTILTDTGSSRVEKCTDNSIDSSNGQSGKIDC